MLSSLCFLGAFLCSVSANPLAPISRLCAWVLEPEPWEQDSGSSRRPSLLQKGDVLRFPSAPS